MSECFKSGVVYLLAEDMWSARELLLGLFPEAVPVRSGGFEVRPGLLVKPVSARGVPNWLGVTVGPQVVYSEGVSEDFLVGPYLSLRSLGLKPLGEWLEELGAFAEQKKCPLSSGPELTPDKQVEIEAGSVNQLQAEAVMNLVNTMIAAFESGFVEGNQLTLSELYQCARMHVQDNYGVTEQGIADVWGVNSAIRCGLKKEVCQ